MKIYRTGKGDLVGCDVNTHLQAYNGTGTSQGNNPDIVVKSSCDVKVFNYSTCKYTYTVTTNRFLSLCFCKIINRPLTR